MLNSIELLREKIVKSVPKSDSLQKETAQLEEKAIEIEADQWKGIPRVDLLSHSMILGMVEQSRQRWKRISLILGAALLLTWVGIIFH